MTELRLCCDCGEELDKLLVYQNNITRCKVCDESYHKALRAKHLEESFDRKLYNFPKRILDIAISAKEKVEEQCVYLYGSAGVGKTIRATQICISFAKKGMECIFISCPNLIMLLQTCVHRKEDPYQIIHEKCLYSRNVLLLDDLGANKTTDFARQCLYLIINEREQNGLKTIITSNYSLAQLSEQIDDRISSRISGMCKVVKMTGSDRRCNST